ncbi:hypothetical protein QBC47DRAFT_391411 [Echria macrotheca]|uniref:Uncharacterized protein n=1 Tax=Echria macrotheca TaxID=438768 RepID=A0AAJ0B658_9PEZI|nr:hypothetical protein QBC47DRAFT_391411 [Echria macrotheca]
MAPEPAHLTQPWTATRCHRLLRPLLAHISSLRKEKARRDLIEAGAVRELGETATTANCRRGFSDATGRLPEKRTGTRNTYSRKSMQKKRLDTLKTPQRKATQPQQRLAANKPSPVVAIPTPFLRRVRDHELSSPLAIRTSATDVAAETTDAPSPPHVRKGRCHMVEGCGGSRCFFESRLLELRQSLDADRFTLYESVLRTLDALLKATDPLKTTRVAAPKSLLAMCLRKVPDYISELEHWEKEDADANGTKSTLNDSRVSAEIYAELESLGNVDGWRNLCVAVRAHGIHVIEKAVVEGLIEDPVTDLLIDLCLAHAPLAECDSLVDAFVERQYPGPAHAAETFNANPPFFPLSALDKYTRIAEESCIPRTTASTTNSWRLEFQLGKLSRLLESGLLPSDWLQTKWSSNMFSATIRCFAAKSLSHRGVMDFVSTAVKLLCRSIVTKARGGIMEEDLQKSAKSQRVLTEYLAALASMVLLGRIGKGFDDLLTQNPLEYETPSSSILNLRNRIANILATCMSKARKGRRGLRQDVGIYLLNLTQFLAFGDCESGTGAGAITESWQDAINRDDPVSLMRLYDATLAHVGAVAHHYNRGTGVSGDEFLSLLCDKLETLDIPGDAVTNLRVDGAFYLAERSGDLRDLAFAESLKARTAAAKNGYRPTSQKKRIEGGLGCGERRLRAGFRWDEDIGEWVTAGDQKPSGVVTTTGARRSSRVSSNAGSVAGGATTASRTLRMRAASRGRQQRLPTPVSHHDDPSDSFPEATSEESEMGSESSEDEDEDDDYSEGEEKISTPDTEVSAISIDSSPHRLEYSTSNSSRTLSRSRAGELLVLLPRRRRNASGTTTTTTTTTTKRALDEDEDYDDDNDDEDDDEDELAAGDNSPVQRVQSRGFKAPRRSYSGRGRGCGRPVVRRSVSLLSLQPLKKVTTTRAAVVGGGRMAHHHRDGGSSDDELSFGMW